MTIKELAKVKFHCVAHLSMEREHTMTYASEDGMLGFCDHTPKRKNGDYGKTYRHYRIGAKIYKSKQKFLEALKDFETKQKEL